LFRKRLLYFFYLFLLSMLVKGAGYLEVSVQKKYFFILQYLALPA
jgi:hypothetical protein